MTTGNPKWKRKKKKASRKLQRVLATQPLNEIIDVYSAKRKAIKEGRETFTSREGSPTKSTEEESSMTKIRNKEMLF